MSTLAKDLMSRAKESGVLVFDGMGTLAAEFRRLDLQKHRPETVEFPALPDQQEIIDHAMGLLRAMRVRDADGAKALAAETLGY